VWKVPKSKHQIFGRNPLTMVVCALDFDPILRISEGKGVGEFQELVRHRFPQYSEGETLDVKITTEQVETQKTKAFEFSSADEKTKLTMGSRRIARETRAHQSSIALIEDMSLALRALSDIYSPVAFRRLGLRYINIVDPTKISEDLGRQVNFDTLVSSKYLNLPGDVIDHNATRFNIEIASPIEGAMLSLRYGIRKPDNGPERWHFDVDCYVAGELKADSIPINLQKFVHHIYDLFITSQGPDLVEWMNVGKSG
jgi:uncharacterized protein (TIGR04255 family)